jgi:spore coat polysaccharide biosynthesis predicted glycosyltransferase SpsG
MPKRVAFKTIGGGEYGFGHVRRSMTLAQSVDSRIEAALVINQNPLLVEQLKGSSLKFHVDTDRDIYPADLDVLVFDQPVDDVDFLCAIRNDIPGLKIIALDYFNYGHDFVDAIINLVDHSPDPIPEAHPAEYNEGLDYAIIRDAFIPYRQARFRDKVEYRHILVTFGGEDPLRHTLKIIDWLNALSLPLIVDVVIGPLFPHKAEVVQAVESGRHDYRIHVNPPEIERLMANAALAFSGSGTTVLELCFLGVPTIVLPQTDAEDRFARTLCAAGAIYAPKCVNIDTIKSFIAEHVVQGRIALKAMELVDGLGKKRIIDRLFSLGE